MITAPQLARQIESLLNTPDLRVLGVRHRNGQTVIDITTPDQHGSVQTPLHYWTQIRHTCHLSPFALWDSYQSDHPTRNVMSTITLVQGKRIEVEWQSSLRYVQVNRTEKVITLEVPRERALMLVAA